MINYIEGDLFTHQPKNSKAISILAHACNARGSWGAGVATVFKSKFPSTYKKYVDHCQQHANDPTSLLGTTLLIPSSSSDPGNNGGKNNFYIACLFTSDFAGRKKLGPKDIVNNTSLSINDLLDHVNALRDKGIDLEDNGKGLVLNMPKINAGLFSVPWEDTADALDKFDLDINVYVID